MKKRRLFRGLDVSENKGWKNFVGDNLTLIDDNPESYSSGCLLLYSHRNKEIVILESKWLEEVKDET